MMHQPLAQNDEVTQFLDGLGHPLRKEIDQLRREVLSAHAGLSENIKWNGPNYHLEGQDRITMRLHPPTQIQLVFHRGAKPLAQPSDRLIGDHPGLLAWKANDRAVATFATLEDIASRRAELAQVINEWLAAAAR